jgi:phosphotransferase family enzyme/methyltransferase family protein
MTLELSQTPAEERQNLSATLRALAADRAANQAIEAGIAAAAGVLYGPGLRLVGHEAIIPPRSDLGAYVRTGRTHARIILADPAGREIRVFVKAGPKQVHTPLEALMGSVISPDFRAPRFLGTFNADDLIVGVWEYIEGERLMFETLPLQTLERLVRAVAGINTASAPSDIAPTKTKWISEPVAWYENRLKLIEEAKRHTWMPALDRLKALHARGDLVAQISDSYGETLLAHNDINPNNVFTPDNGDMVFFDWEGATFTVPGADLRFLVRLPDREHLLDCYIARMAELGYALERDTVHRTMMVVEGFRQVFKAWAKGSLPSVLKGLDLVEANIGPHAQGAEDAPADSPEAAPAAQVDERLVAGADASLPDGADQDEAEPSATIPDSDGETTMPDSNDASTILQSEQPQPASAPKVRQLKDPSPELMAKVKEYVSEKGKVYAPIDHPAFAALPVSWEEKRWDIIQPHLDHKGGTALDIGTHWGYMAHKLEDEGYDVTAIEHSPKHLYFLKEIRDITGREFKVIGGNIFDLKEVDYDVIFALNIFHHFLKTDERFDGLKALLDRTNVKTMIYQGHRESERGKLDTAGHYMNAADMAAFLAERLRLTTADRIGNDAGRDIYKIH